MIISKTPYRVSLFGGGTDFPDWYRRHGGSVISTSIDKYCYIAARIQPPFFDYRYRVVWSKIEHKKDLADIEHPAVRAVIEHLEIERNLEIHHIGDLPARSGMGSSSSFTVGLLNALYALQGKMVSKHDLAVEAIHIEQNVLQEAVGSQDQVAAAYGGFNKIDFYQNGEIAVTPITIPHGRLKELENSLLLFYTGIKRTSSDLSAKLVEDINSKRRQLRIMKDLVDEAISILYSEQDINLIGELLYEAWEVKRSFSKGVTNSEVDEIYNKAISAGAIGGKLTGAGGGGFFLVFVPQERQQKVKEELKNFIEVPFSFDFTGSQIIFAGPEADYSSYEIARVFQPVVEFKELVDL